MSIDLFHSREVNRQRCRYWIRDERDRTGSPQEWVLYNQSAGIFYAKPVSARNNQMNGINGVWSHDVNSVTIETDDHVDNLSRGCLIEYIGELWLVESVQSVPHLAESEMPKKPHFKTIISMTRG